VPESRLTGSSADGNSKKLTSNPCPSGGPDPFTCWHLNTQLNESFFSTGNTSEGDLLDGLCPTEEGFVIISGCGTINAAASGKEDSSEGGSSGPGANGDDPSDLLNLPNLAGKAAEDSGSLSIEGERFSASERAVAQDLASKGKKLVLREATGIGRTSDLVVNGTPYDVYTPEAGTSIRNILSNVASKWTQVKGGGVVIDLSNTDLGVLDFGDSPLANGFVNSWGGTPLSDLLFYGGS
jgi:Contact-dependent growth inhibition CdiA C-terminal domain